MSDLPAAGNQLQEGGADVLSGLFSLTRALRLYDPNNAAVVRIIDELLAALDAFFESGEDELQLRILHDEGFVNGQLMRADLTLYERITSLHGKLAATGFNELTFRRGVQRGEIVALASAMSDALRVAGAQMQFAGSDTLRLGRAEGDSIASFRFEPDKLAVWLHRSLLDLVDALYERVKAGEAPSLLPLRRSLQLVVDSMRAHSGIFQLLTTLRDPREAPGVGNRRVMVAVELIGFGLWVGLPVNEVLTLGLAGILGGIAQGKDPDRAVRNLLRFSGLGDTALPLTLLLHDAVAARSGDPARAAQATLPGRALSLVELYVVQTTPRPGHAAHAPHAILTALAKGAVPWAGKDLVTAFTRYKGPFPLGSLVMLDPGGLAVVKAIQGPQHRTRPRVVRVQADGSAGPVVDLSVQTDVRIVGAPDPAKAGFSPQAILAAT